MLYIAGDHRSFKLKEQLKKFMGKQKIKFVDMGPKKLVPTDDYPDYAALVSQKVSQNPIRDVGVLLCRTGYGVCIVANKYKNVRAAVIHNVAEAYLSRTDDMTNVLCLASEFMSPRAAERVMEKWLETPYSTEPRHIRRVKKIAEIEAKNKR